MNRGTAAGIGVALCVLVSLVGMFLCAGVNMQGLAGLVCRCVGAGLLGGLAAALALSWVAGVVALVAPRRE